MNLPTHVLKERYGLGQLIGESPNLVAELVKIPRIAVCNVSVLITGETGTGKELVARAIHYLSPRSGQPFVPLNCGAVPGELAESELFGHEQGAFTGAVRCNCGLVREARGGTLFLDEVDSLPRIAQVKILRLLQEGEYRSVGSTKVQQADVRIVAATNTNIETALANESFRRDLFFRLNVIPVRLPPLRERKEDIPSLAFHFLRKYARIFNKQIDAISPEAIESLISYDWPGNIRELENAIERAVVLSDGHLILMESVMLPRAAKPSSLHDARSQFEKSFATNLLVACHGNLEIASRTAQTSRRTFVRLLQKHNIKTMLFHN